ncbi:MAG: hypothetical protein KTR31_25895 [Myxococcales bacterium]|nr:hypothetical protein [Myxococcales bacterium]
MTTLLAIWATTTTAQADDPQYRELTLVDGRVLVAEILSTEAQGLRVQMPQGRAVVSFELLQDMVPTDAAAYADQPEWLVWVQVPEAYQEQVETLLDEMPGIDGALAGYGGGASADMTAQIVNCNADVECIAAASAGTPWKWIITGSDTPFGELELFARTNADVGVRASSVTLEGTSRDDFWFAIHDLLRLERPLLGAPSAVEQVAPPPEVPVADERRVVALSFVPVPGLPSLAQKDPVGFGVAMGIVVPSTALWIGAVGETGQSSAEFLALSAAGFYAATVLTNQVLGLRSLRRRKAMVTVVPTEQGTATMTVGASF